MDFPIGHPKYLAPEVVVGGPKGGVIGADDVDMGGSFETNVYNSEGMFRKGKVYSEHLID